MCLGSHNFPLLCMVNKLISILMTVWDLLTVSKSTNRELEVIDLQHLIKLLQEDDGGDQQLEKNSPT